MKLLPRLGYRGGTGGAPPFPVASVLAWMNGGAPAYSDLAGTILAAPGDPFGRTNEIAPLTSDWASLSNSQRGTKEPAGIALQYFGTTVPGQTLQRAAIAVASLNNCTMLISFTARDGANSPQVGLCRSFTPTQFGLFAGNGQTVLNYNANLQWFPAVPNFLAGDRVTIGARWTPTGLKVSFLRSGVTTSDVLNTAITAGAVSSAFQIADAVSANQGFYGSVAQCIVFNSALSDSVLANAMSWAAAQPLAAAYPTTAPLFGIMGDSIARGTVGVNAYQAYCWMSLKNLKATYPSSEMINAAIVGAGAGIPDYNPIAPYYSASRARNVSLVAVGTNNMANGADGPTTLALIYAQCDAARAQGWRIALSTILPRSGLFGGGTTQLQYNTAMTFVNTDILANGHLHADAIVNTTTIAGMGAIGDSNGANYQVDHVHPTVSGMALLEPTITAAMLGLAA